MFLQDICLDNKLKEKVGYCIVIIQLLISMWSVFQMLRFCDAPTFLFFLVIFICPIIPSFSLITPYKNKKIIGIIFGIISILGFIFFLGYVAFFLQLAFILYLLGVISSFILILNGEDVSQNNIVYVVNSNNKVNFCSSCGEKLDSNSKFCPKCGEKL